MKRRECLTSIGGCAAAVLSGCSNALVSNRGLSTNASSDDRGTAGEPSSSHECRYHDWPRLSIEGNVVSHGEIPDVSLSSNEREYKRGDQIVFQLVNTSTEDVVVGDKDSFDIQRKEGTDWVSIYRGYGGVQTFTGSSYSPGEIFDWSFSLTAASLSRREENTFAVCEPLQTGKYRFVFFGIDPRDSETGGISLPFTVTS